MVDVQNIFSKILTSRFCVNTLKLAPQLEKDKAVLFSAIMVSIIGTLLRDNEIHLLEIKLLRKYLQKLLPILPSTKVEELVDMQMTCNEKSDEIKSLLKDSIFYLNETWGNEEKTKFIENLFVLARVDLSISKQEISFIRDISTTFGLDEATFAGIKLNAELALDKVLGKDGSELYIIKGKERFLGEGW